MLCSASLFYRSETPGRDTAEILWEDSIVLIDAISEEVALRKAEEVGKSVEQDYMSATDEHVSWVFVRVERVIAIGDSLTEGTELFSRFLRACEATSLLTPFED